MVLFYEKIVEHVEPSLRTWCSMCPREDVSSELCKCKLNRARKAGPRRTVTQVRAAPGLAVRVVEVGGLGWLAGLTVVAGTTLAIAALFARLAPWLATLIRDVLRLL